jgi:DNA polymerase III subunit delta'
MAAMNWDILGHEWAVNLLQENVGRDQVRHAYLICGPPGIGRRTLALRLAQALNCTQPPSPGVPCLVCSTCRQIEKMQHPDLSVVQAEQEGATLKVDQVRELQRGLALHPYAAKYRVALLLRFEEAHISAMNALLKTLEEPPAQVIILLTAESPEILLPTIVSRCETLRLRPLPLEQVAQGLQTRWNVEADQAVLLAHISGGRPGFALRLLQEPGRLEQRQAWLEEHARLLGANRVERFRFADTWTKPRDKELMRDVIYTWLSLWRDVLLKASGASAPLINLDRRTEIEQLAGQFGGRLAFQAVFALERTLDLLGRNVNLQLAAEVLMLDLPHR